MNWKPIGTAPKDGTEIIVCRAGTDRIEFVEWYEPDFLGAVGGWTDRGNDYFVVPTHWMEKPEIPPGE